MATPQPPELPTWIQVLGAVVIAAVIIIFIFAASGLIG